MRHIPFRKLFLLGLALIPASVLAHAVLVSSLPKDNAVLAAAPKQVVLKFNVRIEKPVSQVSLYAISRDSNSKPTKKQIKLPKQSAGYKSGSDDEVIVSMPRLRPGSYQLEYRVLATDGHLSPGLVRFTISGRKGKS